MRISTLVLILIHQVVIIIMANSEVIKTLNLCGSTKDEYYKGISLIYARDMVNASWHTGRYEFVHAVVDPDSTWKFPQSLENSDIENAKQYTFPEAVAHIKDVLNPDVMIPFLFCPEGMTVYRSLFEGLLNIPYVGCDPLHMGITTDKALTRAIVSDAGVRVPQGIVVTRSDDPRLQTLELPLIVKPTCEDNSIGLSLAKTPEELSTGIEEALKVDSKVLVEQFIPPGKEIRVGLVEKEDGTLQTLPKYEYFVSKGDPIRTQNHKFKPQEKNKELELAGGNRQCPADIPPEVAEVLDEQAKLAHNALKCRDYSLFDFRVDPEGKTYFLEACSYCSFAPKSVLVKMTDYTDIQCPKFFDTMVDAARKRKRTEIDVVRSVKQRVFEQTAEEQKQES